MTELCELGSPAWIAAITDVLRDAMIGLDTQGRSYSISEEFTDPPSHLGHGSVGWHFRITDERVEVFDGPSEDADLVTAIDWTACVPAAKAVYNNDPEAMAQQAKMREEMTAAGKLSRRGDEKALPPELMRRLMAVHDAMAPRTA
jgi:hypothetical protein